MLGDSQRVDWSPYLQPGEKLLWDTRPRTAALLKHTIFLAAVLALLSLPFAWFALVPDDLLDACGPEPSRSCRKMYGAAWFFFVPCSGFALAYFIQFLARLSGLMQTYYAVTNLHALTLWKGIYVKLWKVRLTAHHAYYREFHSIILLADRRRPDMTFVGVDNDKYWELENKFEEIRAAA